MREARIRTHDFTPYFARNSMLLLALNRSLAQETTLHVCH